MVNNMGSSFSLSQEQLSEMKFDCPQSGKNITWPRSKAEALLIVKKSFAATTEICTEELIVPLLCPITKKRLEVPCIGLRCDHLPCFDGNSFMKINQSKNNWYCPLCKCSIGLDDLRVDSLLKEILSQTSPDCTKVSFNRNGLWKPCIEEKSERHCNTVFVPDENTIILDDESDDEDHEMRDVNNSYSFHSFEDVKLFKAQPLEGGFHPLIEIITLDDTF